MLWLEWWIFSLLSLHSSYPMPSTRCFQCSDFPSDPEDRDEPLGPCPGWIRPPITFSARSVYDGCITIILSNGTIVAQGGVVYEYCLGLQVSGSEYVFSVFGVEGLVICCKGSQCAHYLDSTTLTSHHDQGDSLVSRHQAAGEMDATGLEQQQAIVKYPPCQQSSLAIRLHSETPAIIVITLLYHL